MIRYFSPDDDALREIARSMRPADIAECRAADQDPVFSITESARKSAMAWVAHDEIGPVAAFGVVPFGGAGAPWALASVRAIGHRRRLLRDAPHFIELMRRRFPKLVNFVHAENVAAVRWLTFVGFRVYPAAPHWDTGAPFRKFTMGI